MKVSKYAVCETVHGLTYHLREMKEGEELKLSGLSPRSSTLCGLSAAWDCKFDPRTFDRLEHFCVECYQVFSTKNN